MNEQAPTQGLIGHWVHTLAQVAQGVNAGLKLVRGGLEDERNQFIESIATTLLSLFFLAFGCLLAVVAVMLVVPEAWRAGVAVGAAVLFWALAGYGQWRLRHQNQQRRGRTPVPPTH
jgi:uncharacterized membrane protein YqjE